MPDKRRKPLSDNAHINRRRRTCGAFHGHYTRPSRRARSYRRHYNYDRAVFDKPSACGGKPQHRQRHRYDIYGEADNGDIRRNTDALEKTDYLFYPSCDFQIRNRRLSENQKRASSPRRWRQRQICHVARKGHRQNEDNRACHRKCAHWLCRMSRLP